LKIEERVRFLKEINPKKDKMADIQATMDEVVLERKYSKVEHRKSMDDAAAGSNTDVSGQKSSSLEESPVVVVADEKSLGNKVRFSDNSVEV
jgi:hypothetical protein